jgi:hypothetical protein
VIARSCSLRIAAWIAVCGAGSAARAQDCAPEWEEAFATPALDGAVWAMCTHDAGTGPELYAGGSFTPASGANRVGRWDGLAWRPLGAGLDGSVYALASAQLAGAPSARLYAGGAFTSSGGATSLVRVACWDGAQWSALGQGVNGAVRALEHFDFGTGVELVAGGDFTLADGVAATRVARWDGANWQSLGTGFDSSVAALAVHDDGGGARLYAAGYFSKSGVQTVGRIARWNGVSWEGTGAPITQPVLALASWDGQLGRSLVAGGAFSMFASPYIARWDGSAWLPLDSGVDAQVNALAARGPVGAQTLYAGGAFAHAGGVYSPRVARHTGFAWTMEADADQYFPLSGGIVYSLAPDPPKTGAELAAGGTFTASNLSRWFALSTSGLWGEPGGGLDGSALCFAEWTDPFGPALYVGGEFHHAGAAVVERIARWNGAQWSPLAGGIDGTVRALAVHNDASGTALWVAGAFNAALGSHGIPAVGLLRWSGNAWSAPGDLDGEAHALAVHDSGSGPALYVAGEFQHVAGVSAPRIARWHNGAWSAVGAGFDGGVRALSSTPQGLYAGGAFAASGATSLPYLARLVNDAWTSAGPALDAPVDVLAWLAPQSVFAGPPRLYVAGAFTSDGTQALNGLAAFDGAQYTALGSPLGTPTGAPSPPVRALAAFDDGTGSHLYAGGEFAPGSFGASSPGWLARYDGAHWFAVPGAAQPALASVDGAVRALHVSTDPALAGLNLGGAFQRAGGLVSRGIAGWSACAQGTLAIDTPEISLAAGGSQSHILAPGPNFAGALYLVAASISGASPGLVLDGLAFPLVPDAWTSLVLGAPNQGWYHANLALVPTSGVATASVAIPAGLSPAFAGFKLWHAALVFDVFVGKVVWTSTAAELVLAP